MNVQEDNGWNNMNNKHCILCGSEITDQKRNEYVRNIEKYCSTRYQTIIDTLISHGIYKRIYFDHDTELDTPYREIAHLNRNVLQEEKKIGRKFHRKWPDICGIKNGKLKVIIEEERRPKQRQIKKDIEIIKNCKYLLVDREFFDYDDDCMLFIVINDNINSIPEDIKKNEGKLKKVVICNKNSFSKRYKEEMI